MNHARIRRSRLASLAACAFFGCALLGSVRPALAQTTVQIGGPALLDYYQFDVTPPPAFQVVEDVWAWRGREEMLPDPNKVVSPKIVASA